MEDVLALSHEPSDETRPVICVDESSKALRGHERHPLLAEPGAVARVDHRSEHNRKQQLHVTPEPLTGWVAVEVTDRRRTTEWIDQIVELADVDVHSPDADCIRVVMDQLNTHKPAAFSDFFPPAQAKAYLDRFEFHYTPKRESWLNMAEIKIGVLKCQFLDKRIYDAATLRAEVAASGWVLQHRSRGFYISREPKVRHSGSVVLLKHYDYFGVTVVY